MKFKFYQKKFKLKKILQFMKQIKFILEKVKAAICKFQKNIAKYYNRCCIPTLIFNFSNKIFNFVNIHTTCSLAKLAYVRDNLHLLDESVNIV